MNKDKIRIDFIQSIINEFGQFKVFKGSMRGECIREYLDDVIDFCEFAIPKQGELQFDAFIDVKTKD